MITQLKRKTIRIKREETENKNEETWETIVKVSAPFCDDRFCNGLF